MIKISIDAAGTKPGEVVRNITAYLPFDGASFAAQRHRTFVEDWLIVHVGTTGLVPPTRASFDTLKAALVVADKLSRECPSAQHVKLDAEHNMLGPFAAMKAEIIKALAAPTGA